MRVILKMPERLPSPQGKDLPSLRLPEVLNTYTAVMSSGAEEDLQGCPTLCGIGMVAPAQGSILELVGARPESITRVYQKFTPAPICREAQKAWVAWISQAGA